MAYCYRCIVVCLSVCLLVCLSVSLLAYLSVTFFKYNVKLQCSVYLSKMESIMPYNKARHGLLLQMYCGQCICLYIVVRVSISLSVCMKRQF